jgi:hypothetical protein
MLTTKTSNTTKATSSTKATKHGPSTGMDALRLGGVLRAFTRAVARVRGDEQARQQEGEATAPSRPPVLGAPRSLRELGLPGNLAGDIEESLVAMGATRGRDVVGFTFRLPDGSRHPLVLDPEDERSERAA